MTVSAKPWHIRRAHPDDLAAVLDLYDEAVAWLCARGIPGQWGTTPVSARPHLVTEIRDFLAFGIVAENEAIQGFAAVNLSTPESLIPHLGQEAITDGAYVHTLIARRTPAVRGVGADLLRWAGEYAQDQGKSSLRLICWAKNLKLIAYYEGLGFVRHDGPLSDNGYEQLFEKRLAD